MKIIFNIKLALGTIVESRLLLSSQKRLHPDQKANTSQRTAGVSLSFSGPLLSFSHRSFIPLYWLRKGLGVSPLLHVLVHINLRPKQLQEAPAALKEQEPSED